MTNKDFNPAFIAAQMVEMTRVGLHIHQTHTGQRWSYMGTNASVFSIWTRGPEQYGLTKGGSEKKGLSSHQRLKFLEEERPAYDIVDSVQAEFRKIPLFDRADLHVGIYVSPPVGKTPKISIKIDKLDIHSNPLVPRNLAKKIEEKTQPLLFIDEGLPLRVWRMLDATFLAQSPQTALLKYAIFKKPSLLTETSVDGKHPYFPDPALIEDHPQTWDKFCQMRSTSPDEGKVLLRSRA